MSTTRVHFVVHGSVQGVSFRYFTQKRATEHGVTGWVRNTSNGRVEGEAQGSPEAVEAILKDVNRGPSHAHVVKLEKSDLDPVDGEEGFEVRR